MRHESPAATRDLDARISAPPELDGSSRRRRLTRAFALTLLALAGVITWTVVRSQMPPAAPEGIVATPPAATAPEPEPPTQPASRIAPSESAAPPLQAIEPGRPPSSAGVAPLPPEPPMPAPKRKKRKKKPADTDLSTEIPDPPAE